MNISFEEQMDRAYRAAKTPVMTSELERVYSRLNAQSDRIEDLEDKIEILLNHLGLTLEKATYVLGEKKEKIDE